MSEKEHDAVHSQDASAKIQKSEPEVENHSAAERDSSRVASCASCQLSLRSCSLLIRSAFADAGSSRIRPKWC